jgi:hydroxymethylpyrimidine kinase/phosphomethylpyrimidine kinase
MLELKAVRMDFPADANIIVGQSHFIKTVEDLYEAIVSTVPQAKFVLYDGREFTEFRAERIDTKNTHGSGCIFASAIAANLAHKKTVRESVTAAKDFITTAIRTRLDIGKGYGPANPMALLYQKAGLDR